MFSLYGNILCFLLFRYLHFLRGSQQIFFILHIDFLTGEIFAVLSALLLAFGSIQIFDNSQFSEELLAKVIFFLSRQTLAQFFYGMSLLFPFVFFPHLNVSVEHSEFIHIHGVIGI